MNSRVALITFLDGRDGSGNYPDNSLPGSPVYPSQGLPGGGNYPSQGLPGGPNYPSGGPVYPGGPVDPGYGQGHPRPGYPSTGFPPNYPTTGPIFPPVGPDNTLPDNSAPPSLSLPIVLPPVINPVPPGHTRKFELKYSYRYGWVLVPVSDGAEIDNTLPANPEPK